MTMQQSSLTFYVLTKKFRMALSKCSIQGLEAEWETINWNKKFKDIDLDDMWKSLKDQFEESVKKFIPTSIPKHGCKPKPAWMRH